MTGAATEPDPDAVPRAGEPPVPHRRKLSYWVPRLLVLAGLASVLANVLTLPATLSWWRHGPGVPQRPFPSCESALGSFAYLTFDQPNLRPAKLLVGVDGNRSRLCQVAGRFRAFPEDGSFTVDMEQLNASARTGKDRLTRLGEDTPTTCPPGAKQELPGASAFDISNLCTEAGYGRVAVIVAVAKGWGSVWVSLSFALLDPNRQAEAQAFAERVAYTAAVTALGSL